MTEVYITIPIRFAEGVDLAELLEVAQNTASDLQEELTEGLVAVEDVSVEYAKNIE